MVKPKKHLGQHFLTDKKIAEKITSFLSVETSESLIEIGPGKGVLTQFLFHKYHNFNAVEIDDESVEFLQNEFEGIGKLIINEDFLKLDLEKRFVAPLSIIGNFPYNISSQILFKVYHNRDIINEVVGMFQKEVANRVICKPGKKEYGILSVLLQAFFNIEYCFTVKEGSFFPPPKVKSGVIKLVRNSVIKLECDEKLFLQVVKTSFNQRRKTIRNSLKAMTSEIKTDDELFNKRPEQLSVGEFVKLTNIVAP